MDPLQIDHRLDVEQRTCRAIVTTPRGQRFTFDCDRDTGLFKLAGVLPAGMAFPLAFGFVPSTRAKDGKPIDVLILAEDALPVGCLVTVKILGVIEVRQTENSRAYRSDRLVARIAQSREFADIERLDQLTSAFVELARFFTAFNELEGYRFEVLSVADAAKACSLIEDQSAGADSEAASGER